MSRNWKELQSDEIYAIWKEYLRTERFGCHSDPLNLNTIPTKPMRLTPIEIIRLVDELLDRLEVKEEEEDAEEMDSRSDQAQRIVEEIARCKEGRKDSCCKAKKSRAQQES